MNRPLLLIGALLGVYYLVKDVRGCAEYPPGSDQSRWEGYCAASPIALAERVERDMPGVACAVVVPVVLCLESGATLGTLPHMLGVEMYLRRKDQQVCAYEVARDGWHEWGPAYKRARGGSVKVYSHLDTLAQLVLLTTEEGVYRRTDAELRRIIELQAYLAALPGGVGE